MTDRAVALQRPLHALVVVLQADVHARVALVAVEEVDALPFDSIVYVIIISIRKQVGSG